MFIIETLTIFSEETPLDQLVNLATTTASKREVWKDKIAILQKSRNDQDFIEYAFKHLS